MIKSLKIAFEGTYSTGKTTLAKELSRRYNLNFVSDMVGLNIKLTKEANEMFFVTDCTPVNFLVKGAFRTPEMNKREFYNLYKKCMSGLMNYDYIFLLPHDVFNPNQMIYKDYAQDNLIQSAIAGYLLSAGLMHNKKVKLLQSITINDRIREIETQIKDDLNVFQQIQKLK